MVASFHPYPLFIRERYYRYLTEKQKNSWKRKTTNFFSFESKLSIVFHPSIIGVFILPFTNCANNGFILSKEIVLENWPGWTHLLHQINILEFVNQGNNVFLSSQFYWKFKKHKSELVDWHKSQVSNLLFIDIPNL